MEINLKGQQLIGVVLILFGMAILKFYTGHTNHSEFLFQISVLFGGPLIGFLLVQILKRKNHPYYQDFKNSWSTEFAKPPAKVSPGYFIASSIFCMAWYSLIMYTPELSLGAIIRMITIAVLIELVVIQYFKKIRGPLQQQIYDWYFHDWTTGSFFKNPTRLFFTSVGIIIGFLIIANLIRFYIWPLLPHH